MSNQSKISKEQLAKNMIMFIRHNIFLPENDKLKQFMKMIDDYIALSQILELTNLKLLDYDEVLEFLDNWGYRQGNMPQCNDDDFIRLAHAIVSHFSKPEIIYSEKIWQELSEAKIRLNAVLCDPEGKCCIAGSDGDREIIDGTLKDIDKVIDIMKSLNKGE